MKNLYNYSILILIFLILLSISSLTFEVVRIKVTLFEIILPWIFLLYLKINFQNKFKSLASFSVIILIFTTLFFLSAIGLYFRDKFYPVSYERLLLNILFFVFLLSSLEENLSVRKIHRVIFYSAVVILGFGVFQIFGIDPLNYSKEYLNKRRIYSTLANPNNLALFCNMVFFLGLYYLLQEKNKGMFLILPLSVIGIIFTKSGSGILSLLLGTSVIAWGYKKRIRKVVFFLILLFVIITALFLIYLKPESFHYRISLWRSTLNMIKAKPFLGWGLGSFQHVYPAFRDPKVYLLLKDFQIEFLHPENYFLDLMIEGGIFYLLLFLSLNTAVFCYLIREKNTKKISLYYIAILVAFLFQNVFSECFYSFTPFFLYVLILGLCLREIKRDSSGRKILLSSRFYRGVFVLFFAINIAVVYFSLRIFRADFYLRKAVYNSQIKQFPIAEAYYLKSISLNYFNPLSHYLLGNLYLEKGNEEDLYSALKFYNNTEQLAGNYLQLYFLKAIVYHRLKNKKWYQYYLQKTLKTNPYLYYRLKDYEN